MATPSDATNSISAKDSRVQFSLSNVPNVSSTKGENRHVNKEVMNASNGSVSNNKECHRDDFHYQHRGLYNDPTSDNHQRPRVGGSFSSEPYFYNGGPSAS